MTFVDEIRICFTKKYVTFSGRASMSEYWSWVFFILIIQIALYLSLFLSAVFVISGDNQTPRGMEILISLSYIFAFIVFLPSLAVTVRRLHDVNRSGWWLLIGFTFIGLIPLMYWMCKFGDENENNFGILELKEDQF